MIFWNNVSSFQNRHAYIAIFLSALLARLTVVAIFSSHINWDFISHGHELGQVAENLVQGRGFSSPFSDGVCPTAWFPPLVPLVWAIIFKLFGLFSTTSLYAIIYVDIILGCLSCLFYYEITKLILHRAGHENQKTPFFIAVAISVWPGCLFFLTAPWYRSWQEFAMVLSFYIMIKWITLPSYKNMILMAFAGAFGMMITQNVAIIYAGGVLYALIYGEWTGWRLVLHTSIIVFVMLLAITPWAARNYAQMGSIFLFRSNFGIELRQGNGPDATIRQCKYSLHPALNHRERLKYIQLGEASYAQVALEKSLEYIKKHPMETVRRAVTRLYLYWCTDLFGQYYWDDKNQRKQSIWWLFVKKMCQIIFYLLPFIMLLIAVVSKWAFQVPFKKLFLWIFIIVPLPYYLATVGPSSSQATMPWLLMFVLIVVALKMNPAEKE